MGRIGAPYGIRGWVKLVSFAESPQSLLDHRVYHLADPAAEQGLVEIEIDEARPQGQGLVGHIKGCDAPEAARRFTGRELLLPKDALPVLREGYYWHQLEGLRVRNRLGEDLGVVDHLMETGANDVLVVRGDADSIDTTERLLPWVQGQVVLKVDLAAGLIEVDWGADY